LGPKFGKLMKALAAMIQQLSQEQIKQLETEGKLNLMLDGEELTITGDDVEIITEDIPGWSVVTEGNVTVALDITITPELQNEGLARELVNRVQNLRKEKGFEVTDRIVLEVVKSSHTDTAFHSFENYICSETLSLLRFVDQPDGGKYIMDELIDGIKVAFNVEKE